jgi:hypothetical protein
MTVRELITRLLDFNMEAEVKIDQPYNDPKPTVGGLELDGKLYDINSIDDGMTNTYCYINIDAYEDIKEDIK